MDQIKFTADYEAVQSATMAFYNLRGAVPTVPAATAWNLYINTKSASLGMQIFGRHIFDADGQIALFKSKMPENSSAQMPSFMVGIATGELDNFGRTNDTQSGSVLLIGRDKWNFTINDTWLCGGANGMQQFHPASPVTERNIFSAQHILTITGRELFGLTLAGYKEHFSGQASLGKIYVPDDRAKAEALSLVDYQVAMSTIKSIDQAKAVFANAGFKIAA